MIPLLQTYEGYLEKGRFYPIGAPVSVQGRRRVIVTLLNEPAQDDETTRRLAALDKFFAEIEASDEEIPETFERVNFSREVDL